MSLQPKMTADEIGEFLSVEFPQIDGRFKIESVGPMTATMSMLANEGDLRPGGTVSGPAMFALADVAFYVVTLAMIGPQALTVTTGCTINFMRKPEPGRLLADARILKLGRSLCVGDVLLHSGDADRAVAHASMTYSIPPQR